MLRIALRNFRSAAIAPVAAMLVLAGCGKEDAKEDAGKATLVLADSKTATDNGTYPLARVDSCSVNADTGLATIKFSQGDGKPSLTLLFKDFRSTPKKYDCVQAADNKGAADVGGKYDSCAIDAKVPSAAGSTTLNGYSMYRDVPTMKAFTYAGACSVDITAATPVITGKYTCTDMIQTTLEGAVRNPIDATINGDVSGDFSCTRK